MKKEQFLQMLQSQQASGLSIKAYCQTNGWLPLYDRCTKNARTMTKMSLYCRKSSISPVEVP